MSPLELPLYYVVLEYVGLVFAYAAEPVLKEKEKIFHPEPAVQDGRSSPFP